MSLASCLLYSSVVFATTFGTTLVGIDAHPIEVEVELSQGIPHFCIVGLGDTAVQEARHRIHAALRASQLYLPHKRITINLAPADLRKDGTRLDLPMALGLLTAAKLLHFPNLSHTIAIGELALSGNLRPVKGILPAAELARTLGYSTLIVPEPNGAEAAVIEGLQVIASPNLTQLVRHLNGEYVLPSPKALDTSEDQQRLPNLKDVRGQYQARRAMEVAAAGRHNLLLIGNPGCGKTMLAQRLPSILPDLQTEEQIMLTRIRSATGLIGDHKGLVTCRPFRAPHHTISSAGLLGGGQPIKPGEVTLAHGGVLFIDEIPEMPRRILESLRQPLEDHEVVISRYKQTVRLPAAFMLVGAANPCPCGWYGHSSGRCKCSPEHMHKYAQRFSGALLDRVDLIAETPSLTPEELLDAPPGEASESIRLRVKAAHKRQIDRGGCTNSELSGNLLRGDAHLSTSSRALLRNAARSLGMSARGLDRVLRVARTIADLAGECRIQDSYLVEALHYRNPSNWRSR